MRGLPAHWLLACAVAAGATWVALHVARRVDLVDRPGPTKPHRAPVPFGGGIGVAVGVSAASAGGAESPDLTLLACMWALAALGLVDDARDLRARTRLLAHAVVALPVVFSWAPRLGAPRPLEVALALLFVLGSISAFKCIDCADGVAAGVTVAGALWLGTLDGWSGDVGPLAATLGGAAAGFLLFNAPPARCFLGESGSTILGCLLSFLVLGVARDAPADASLSGLAAAATVLMIPFLDFLLVHIRRLRAGVRSIGDLMASAGTDHLPHRLQQAGLGPAAVAAVCAAAIVVSGAAASLFLFGGLGASLLGGVVVAAAFALWEMALKGRGCRTPRATLGRSSPWRQATGARMSS